jgi:hypothetical protein
MEMGVAIFDEKLNLIYYNNYVEDLVEKNRN